MKTKKVGNKYTYICERCEMEFEDHFRALNHYCLTKEERGPTLAEILAPLEDKV